MKKDIPNCVYLFDQNESLVQIFKAHKEFPYKVSPATVQRYFRQGISTPNGHFKLETATCGHKRFTSREAILRFLKIQGGEVASQRNILSVTQNAGMTQSERKREMKRLGLRSHGEPKTDKSKLKMPQ